MLDEKNRIGKFDRFAETTELTSGFEILLLFVTAITTSLYTLYTLYIFYKKKLFTASKYKDI